MSLKRSSEAVEDSHRWANDDDDTLWPKAAISNIVKFVKRFYANVDQNIFKGYLKESKPYNTHDWPNHLQLAT